MQRWIDEIKSMLSWAMLAASTVGPGSVIVCSKSGSDYGVALLWCLIVASAVAYCLQEGAARLAIGSGLNLGQALRQKYKRQGEEMGTPLICYIAAAGVLAGNMAYQANIFVGGMAALYVFHPDTAAFRVPAAFVFGIALACLLFSGGMDKLSMLLGMIVLFMALIFGVAAAQIGVPLDELEGGFVPSIPQGSAVLVLSMIGTTALPYNLFLASSLADGCSLMEMRRGLFFSTFTAAVASVMIVIVGSKVKGTRSDEFTVQDLTDVLQETVGGTAVTCFCLGLVCAAFSAACGVALGAGVSLQALLQCKDVKVKGVPRVRRELASGVHGEAAGAGNRDALLDINAPAANDLSWMDTGSSASAAGTDESPAAVNNNGEDTSARSKQWDEGSFRFNSVLSVTLVIGIVAAAADWHVVNVVVFAQVLNGLLLPFLSVCLLLCLNDRTIMRDPRYTQSKFTNVALLTTVAATIYLAMVVLLPMLAEAWPFVHTVYLMLDTVHTEQEQREESAVFAASAILTAAAMLVICAYLVSSHRSQCRVQFHACLVEAMACFCLCACFCVDVDGEDLQPAAAAPSPAASKSGGVGYEMRRARSVEASMPLLTTRTVEDIPSEEGAFI